MKLSKLFKEVAIDHGIELNEGSKETAEIKEKIKALVQQLKDESSYLLPDGAKDLAIDMIKKMDIK